MQEYAASHIRGTGLKARHKTVVVVVPRRLAESPIRERLEVLDPDQNHTFVDNYLAVSFDLSQVLFIANAKTLDTIPGPLRDRMEILGVVRYTDEEKIGIPRQYLIPKVLAAHGLATDELSFEAEAIRQIVRGYTREAGVRNVDREIAAVARRMARRLVEDRAGADPVCRAGAGRKAVLRRLPVR